MSQPQNEKASYTEATDLTSSARCTLGSLIQDDFKYFTGKILTLADATFSDPEQRKAFKDLLRQTIDHFQFTAVQSSLDNVFDNVAREIGDYVPKRDNKPPFDFILPIGFNYTRTEK